MAEDTLLVRRRTALKAIGIASVASGTFSGISTAQSTIEVPGDESTVADAVEAASSGDTIEVEAGTYDGNVTVDKSLTIVGAGRDATILDGDDKSGYGFRIEAKDVEIEDLQITGFRFGINIPANSEADGLSLEDITLADNALYGVWGPSSSDDIQLDDFVFDGVIAKDHNDEFFSRGAWFMRGVSNISVENSEFSNNALVGFDLGTSDAAGSGGHSGVSISDCVIEANGDAGLAIHDATGVEINWNNIEGNETGLINGGSETIEATENWWGHASGPGGEDGRTNPAGREVGQGDDIDGDVDFVPWLRRPIDHPSR